MALHKRYLYYKTKRPSVNGNQLKFRLRSFYRGWLVRESPLVCDDIRDNQKSRNSLLKQEMCYGQVRRNDGIDIVLFQSRDFVKQVGK
jgi:hypothetical protein